MDGDMLVGMLSYIWFS